MALFRRSSAAPIPDFWNWWESAGRHLATAAITSGDWGDLPATINDRVAAIDPGLSWHFGAGTSAQHALTVTAGGIAERRPLAERWLRGSPAPDATWEFSSSQRATAEFATSTLQLGGIDVDVAVATFELTVDRDRQLVDVGVFHPAFASLPHEARGQATFLILDWALGEDTVTRWLGEITPRYYAPAHPSSIAELQAKVAELRDDHDPNRWAVASIEGSGSPLVLMLRTGVRWIDEPTLDLHHEIVARYRRDANGFPDQEVLDRLRTEEDPLEDGLAGRGVLMATVTGKGRRVIHFYTDGEDQNAGDAIASFAQGIGRRIRSRRDPAWRALRAFGL